MDKELNLTGIPIEGLYSNIKYIIEEVRTTVYRAANFAMVKSYWKANS